MTLRAVEAGEQVPAKNLTVTEAAASGSARDLQVAMRERVAAAVQSPKTSPRDLAALTRRLQEIAEKIEALDARMAEEARENASSPDEAWDAEAI